MSKVEQDFSGPYDVKTKKKQKSGFRRGSCRSCSSVGHLLPKKASSAGHLLPLKASDTLHSFHSSALPTQQKGKKAKIKEVLLQAYSPLPVSVNFSPHFCCLCLCDVSFGASNKSPPSWGCVVSKCESVCPFCPCFKYGFWSTCECTVCIVSVFSLSWVSLSYTLATSRCLGGLAFVLCIRLANNLGENQKKKMTLFLQPPPLESSRLASKIWIAANTRPIASPSGSNESPQPPLSFGNR